MTTLVNTDRRSFLIKSAAVTGGLMVGVRMPQFAHAAETQGPEVTHWIVIEPDDTVIIRIARSEMGQGSFTGLPMLIAEELECDWSKVRPEYASVNEHVKRARVFGSMSTGGSRAIRDSNEYLRKAGAAAREMLVTAAAKEWGVPAAELTVANSVITHKASNRTTTFGKMAPAASKLEVPKEPKLKDPKDWKLIGTSPPRFDIPDKTVGKPVFAADVSLPGMLHASIAQVPVFGGKLKSFDESKIKGMRGVKKVVAAPAPGRTNGLRDLAAACGLPVLEHPPSIGGRYAALSIVGLLPAMARGSDARLLRAGARAVIEPLIAGLAANAYAPAVGAAVATTLAIERGVRVNVMMPYNDRLHRFGAWYAQLWAESLGKGGQGTTPLACLGPLDQHSQLQLFMDGAPEHYLTVVRAVEATTSPPMPHDLARLAGIDFMGGRTIDALVAAQAEAVSDALMQAGRPVRTITLDRLDEASLGALMMHMMLETILSAHLLGVDPFDQPAVELAKQLTRRRLSPQD